MTVTAAIPMSGPHIADGVNYNWPFTFKCLALADMRLEITEADGSNPVYVTNGFTISPSGLNNDAGGAVVYPISPVAALAAGKIVRPFRLLPLTQPNKIGNQGGFFPETHEQTFDRLEMQIQQIDEANGRAIKVPRGGAVPVFKATEQGQPLTLDADGNVVTGAIISGLATTFMADVNLTVTSPSLLRDAARFKLLTPRDFQLTGDPEPGSGVGVDDSVAFAAFLLEISKNVYSNADWGGTFNTAVAQFVGPFNGQWANSIEVKVEEYYQDPLTPFEWYKVLVTHVTPAGPTTFEQSRIANPSYWSLQAGPKVMATLRIGGHLKLIATASMLDILSVRNAGFLDLDGFQYAKGVGSTSFASRAPGVGCRSGFRNINSGRIRTRGMRAENFYGYGIVSANGDAFGGTNANSSGYGRCHLFDCGSGYVSAGYTGNLTATFSSRTNTGSSGSAAQRTILEGISQHIPVEITDIAAPGIQSMGVRINGDRYEIASIDRGANTVTTYGWVDPAIVSGSLDYDFGGLLSVGGDSGTLHFEIVDAQRIGAIRDCALYGSEFTTIVSQSSGIGYSKGGSPTSATLGGRVGKIYVENCLDDLMAVSASAVTANHGLVDSEHALNLAKVRIAQVPRLSGGAYGNNLSNLLGLTLRHQGEIVHVEAGKTRLNNIEASSVVPLYFGYRGPEQSYYKNTVTFALNAAKAGLNNLTGVDSLFWTVKGSGINGSPTTVTVNPPTGASINGAAVNAAAVFTNFGRAARFGSYHQVATNNYVIVVMTGQAENGWTAMTGTQAKGALAAYAAGAAVPAVGAVYVQAEVNAIVTRLNLVEPALQAAMRRMAAYDAMLFALGHIKA